MLACSSISLTLLCFLIENCYLLKPAKVYPNYIFIYSIGIITIIGLDYVSIMGSMVFNIKYNIYYSALDWNV